MVNRDLHPHLRSFGYMLGMLVMRESGLDDMYSALNKQYEL